MLGVSVVDLVQAADDVQTSLGLESLQQCSGSATAAAWLTSCQRLRCRAACTAVGQECTGVSGTMNGWQARVAESSWQHSRKLWGLSRLADRAQLLSALALETRAWCGQHLCRREAALRQGEHVCAARERKLLQALDGGHALAARLSLQGGEPAGQLHSLHSAGQASASTLRGPMHWPAGYMRGDKTRQVGRHPRQPDKS